MNLKFSIQLDIQLDICSWKMEIFISEFIGKILTHLLISQNDICIYNKQICMSTCVFIMMCTHN